MKLVLIPSDYEAAPLVRRLQGRTRRRLSGGAVLHTGRLADKPLCVAVIGMGAPARARAAQAMDAVRPECALLAGFCGALSENLDVGELFLTTEPLAAWPTPWSSARLHTADAVIATAEERLALHERTGADCVDMEQSHVAHAARERGIPLLGVRIISDTPQSDVPHRALEKSYDWARAKPTPLRMALYLATHPGDIVRLMAFLRPLGPVREKLAGELVDYLAESAD